MTDHHDMLLRHASEGNVEQLQQLLDGQSHIIVLDALDKAAANGHMECIKILFPLCNPEHGLAAWEAACHGQCEALQFFLDQGLHEDDNLTGALSNQQWECARTLMPYCKDEGFGHTLIHSFDWEDDGVEVEDIERARGMILDFVGADRLFNTLSFMDDVEDEELYGLALEWLDIQKNQEQKIRIEQQILNNNASHTRKM